MFRGLGKLSNGTIGNDTQLNGVKPVVEIQDGGH